MNYAELTYSILPKVLLAAQLINNPEIDPDVRLRNQEILFATVGSEVYAKSYDMNAFDMNIEYTKGKGIGTQHYGLAKMVSGGVSTGVEIDTLIGTYLMAMATKAQEDATYTARESGERPTVTRRIVSETCKWCRSLAGVHTDPDPEVFARHANCDCSIVTSGYKSRNGLLKNYVKQQGSKR